MKRNVVLSVRIIFYCFISILLIASIVRHTGSLDMRVVDIFSHFPVQYAMFALICMAIGLWKRRSTLVVVAGVLFFMNVSVLVETGKADDGHNQAGETFKVYSANINKDNSDIIKLIADLKQNTPDIVFLQEVTPSHNDKLRLVVQYLPYHVGRTSIGSHRLGYALFSKFPVLDHRIIMLSEVGNSMLIATLKIGSRKVIFYGTHSQNPIFTNDFSDRTGQFMNLAQEINERSAPVIVAGDMNTTPFSPVFREFIRVSGLRDSRNGFGWQPSWPANFPFLWLPIDHILVSQGIRVNNRTTGPHIGSDHYPVFAELSIRE